MNNQSSEKVGEMWISKEGYILKIIDYISYKNCTIEIDNKYVLKNKTYQNIKNGEVKNPYHFSVYNIGYIGIGKYKTSICNKPTLAYKCWNSMLQRCYDKKFIDKNLWYSKCEVDYNWHNFQNFAEWFEKNYVKGYELDKDIINNGNKIYSPTNCCFVPKEINNLFANCKKQKRTFPIGVSKLRNKYLCQLSLNGINHKLGIFDTVEEAFNEYKKQKENQIKKLAIYFKNSINKKVYNSLMSYSIKVTN